jgi:hypothetical protein
MEELWDGRQVKILGDGTLKEEYTRNKVPFTKMLFMES